MARRRTDAIGKPPVRSRSGSAFNSQLGWEESMLRPFVVALALWTALAPGSVGAQAADSDIPNGDCFTQTGGGAGEG
jgi:hypothetical protein